MAVVQREYGPAEPSEHRPHTIKRVAKSGQFQALELLVKIGDRDRTIRLDADVLTKYGLTGPEAVEELRAIRTVLEEAQKGENARDRILKAGLERIAVALEQQKAR